MINVLIVEDDPMVAEINKSYIESSQKFKVAAIASNGKEALKILVNNKNIDLLIVDIFMPEMNGIALIQNLRKKHINVDIIYITASKRIDDVDTALKYGAVDYLVKPFSFERFLKAIERYEERYYMLKGLKESPSITQENIDNLVTNKNNDNTNLPKGLEEKTFNKIYNFLNTSNTVQFTLQQVSIEIEITTVTIRKYLKYMENLGYVKLFNEYGDVGRPKTKYHNLLNKKIK